MKKTLLLSIFSALSLCSCKRDEESPIVLTPQQKLIGTWKISKYTTVSGNDNSIMTSENATGCTANNTYQFSGNSKLLFKYFSGTGTNCTANGEQTGYYYYDNPSKILSFHYANNTSDYLQIVSIENSEFVVLVEVKDYDGDGAKDRKHAYYKKQ